ncbi:ATP-binding protein [Solimonas sp. C16B3]|uniref:histidine kinase n=1 Tax=Solimonas marina TaxID=2714601 RepID=A0A969WC12_9GAMM|nr:ATP-binding protein [Solimonas marina]NKF23419.1 ATP-binding protein [Solimonas marina]
MKATAARRPRVTSLRARLLVSTAIVLLAFVGLGGLALEKAFESALLQAQQDKLEGLIYALLGAASTTPDGELTISLDAVPDRRLREPLSGLQAALFNELGIMVWSSNQSLDMPPPPQLAVGQWNFQRLDKPDAFRLSFGLRWIDSDRNTPRLYTVSVIDDTSAFDRQLGIFRRTLWTWLGGTVVALVVILLLILRWSLAPLKRLGRELHMIESGLQGEIEGSYPDELKQLTRDLNAMIVSERNQQTRYRNALGDLAHTLKTPLAVLRGISSEPDIPGAQQRQLDEQVGRMQHIVDHQLRRAAAAGSRTLTEPVALKPLVDKLMSALSKVYASRNITFENELDPILRLRADQGDLYEMLGNLIENAAKYGNQRVRVAAQVDHNICRLDFDDDGPGFPSEAPEKLLERGARADTRLPGQGIGLAAVNEIVQAYGGRLLLERSMFGGGRVSVLVPIR